MHYSKKQHIARKAIIICLAFAGGMISTVLAAAVYDANVQSRANTIFDVIKNNASTMDPADSESYYQLVRLNIKSLVEVLTLVDGKILTELGSTLPGLDPAGIIGQITGTGNSNSGTSNSGNTGTTISTGSSSTGSIDTVCKKNISIGNLTICDTDKKSAFASKEVINTLCPSGLHVPNYWEMKYIFDAGIKLDIDKYATYYVNSLYGEIVRSPGYPYNNYPYTFVQSGYMNHTNDLGRGLNILCINNANIPTTDTNGVVSCKLVSDTFVTAVSGKYSKSNAPREHLIEGESILLESDQNQLSKGNIDFTLKLSCNKGNIIKSEIIKKINSCTYGYTIIDNDCKVDPLMCNLENLGNFHPTTSKACSWKQITIKEYIARDENGGIRMFHWNNVYDRGKFEEIKKDWDEITKKQLLDEYRLMYNNKIDINVNCEIKKEGEISYKITYICNVNGLFWQ